MDEDLENALMIEIRRIAKALEGIEQQMPA